MSFMTSVWAILMIVTTTILLIINLGIYIKMKLAIMRLARLILILMMLTLATMLVGDDTGNNSKDDAG